MFSGLLTILAAVCRTPVQVFHILPHWGPWTGPKVADRLAFGDTTGERRENPGFPVTTGTRVVYLVPAALTLLVSINPAITDNGFWRSLCDLHSAGCIVGTIALACSLFAYAQGNILHQEEGRELFGLVIIIIWMSLCRSSAKSPLRGVRLIAAVVVALFPFVSWLYIYVNKEMRASWPTHCKTVI
ncbi:PREDICTED: transmembrane protein 220 [Pygoscelis adeliae]|nr:PREDICTED: transmembrane protein 220 [Pygoscelis adeliae]